jgi:hypothetical protein
MRTKESGRVEGAACVNQKKILSNNVSTCTARSQQKTLCADSSQQDLNSALTFIRRGLLDLGMELEGTASILSLHASPNSRRVALNRLNCVEDMLTVLLYHLQVSLGENDEVSR